MGSMRNWLSAVVLMGAAGTMSLPAAESPLGAVRTGVEQWVQTRQLISRTRADWDSEKEMLLQSKALYERELAGVADQMSKVSTNFTQVERDREAAEKELKESNEALEGARGLVSRMEERVRELLPRLPAPLVDTMQPLLARLPENSADTRMTATERAQTVVGLLNEIDKWNNAVSIVPEKRRDGQGAEVSVETVYVGLGAAYFVNQTGEFAGLGRPGPRGWDWMVDTSLARPVREVVRIYRGERTATFIPLPVTLQ